ncbi:hypothetical protein GNI_006450, partial [Gregarina niphandrodes]
MLAMDVSTQVPPAVDEAQVMVADVIRDCFHSRTDEVRGSPKLFRQAMNVLEFTILSQVHQKPAGSERYCTWRWARLAGELYRRLDRGRVLTLLKECEPHFRRPPLISDQWYLAKLLQQWMPHMRVARLLKCINLPSDRGFKSALVLDDVAVGRCFTGLPAVNESDEQLIWTFCHAVGWLLKSHGGEYDYETLASSGYWIGPDEQYAELAGYLYKLWGPARSAKFANLCRTLLPQHIPLANLPDPRLFTLVVKAMAGVSLHAYRTLRSQCGFYCPTPVGGRPRARPVASEENAAARKKNAVALVQEAVVQTALVQEAVTQTAVAQKAVVQTAV